jgi:hypothetical protein
MGIAGVFMFKKTWKIITYKRILKGSRLTSSDVVAVEESSELSFGLAGTKSLAAPEREENMTV